jgi:hypothetical protein
MTTTEQPTKVSLHHVESSYYGEELLYTEYFTTKASPEVFEKVLRKNGGKKPAELNRKFIYFDYEKYEFFVYTHYPVGYTGNYRNAWIKEIIHQAETESEGRSSP